jgi:hypothetical protein
MVFFISIGNESNVLCRGTRRRVAVGYWYVRIWRLKTLYKSWSDRRSWQGNSRMSNVLVCLESGEITRQFSLFGPVLEGICSQSSVHKGQFDPLHKPFRAEHHGEMSFWV